MRNIFHMTFRKGLTIIIVLGLSVTMAVWGWIQLETLDKILVEQQAKRLSTIAETVGTYYQLFPTGRGLAALDTTLKEQVQADPRMARIDILTHDPIDNDIDYIAGAGRIGYEWPESLIKSVLKGRNPQYLRIEQTDSGPAVGLLYPIPTERKQEPVFVGVIAFSRYNQEILTRAKRMLLFSTLGLLAVILLFVALSYRWLIGYPLRVIIRTMDAFQKGQYVKRITWKRQDEWGLLASHFNAMAGEIERVLARNRDLTRHLEDRVREATTKVVSLQHQVNQLQQLTTLGFLTATLAHDLGTPLHSIAGMARLLLERGDWPGDVARKLELIVQQTERLHETIQNVRQATRLPDPRFETVTVADLFNDTLPLVEPLLARTGIECRIRIAESLPRVDMDRHRVQTALLNLIHNAIEAMPGGGILTLAAAPAPGGDGMALSVQDTGLGIPPELQGEVCKPFFSTHREEGLRGLGLAIVQDTVKLHRGRIAIESEPGKGTQVTLFLPRSAS